MSKVLAICQSNYIPWKGYFDLICSADEFVIYDTAQYTKNDWRNRNRIRTQQGSTWLSIPVETSGKFGQAIQDVTISNDQWARTHWKTIQQNYNRATYFADYKDILEPLYHRAASLRYLSEVNYLFLETINELLKIRTKIRWSKEFQLPEGQTEPLISLCQQLGATEYLSGPRAQAYLNVNLFETNGIKVRWIDYLHYPEYSQCFPGFDPHVSIIDLILNTGPNALRYMKR
jgi:hypothetical protein